MSAMPASAKPAAASRQARRLTSTISSRSRMEGPTTTGTSRPYAVHAIARRPSASSGEKESSGIEPTRRRASLAACARRGQRRGRLFQWTGDSRICASTAEPSSQRKASEANVRLGVRAAKGRPSLRRPDPRSIRGYAESAKHNSIPQGLPIAFTATNALPAIQGEKIAAMLSAFTVALRST